MKLHTLGTAVLGSTARKAVALTEGTPYVVEPYQVIISPAKEQSTTYGTLFEPNPASATPIDRIVAHGGQMQIPAWDKSNTQWNNPDRVEVYLKGQTAPSVFSGDIQTVTASGGRRVKPTGAQHVLGAYGLPASQDLVPYFLTTMPIDGEQLTLLYNSYLGAFDSFIDNIHSVFHMIDTGAVQTALRTVRAQACDWWAQPGISRLYALQLLAGTMGYFNAHYVDSNGNVNWDALNQPVNAGIIEGGHDAAKAVVDAAKKAGKITAKLLSDAEQKIEDTASTLWWTVVIGGAVIVLGGGALLWKSMSSGTAQAAFGRFTGR